MKTKKARINFKNEWKQFEWAVEPVNNLHEMQVTAPKIKDKPVKRDPHKK